MIKRFAFLCLLALVGCSSNPRYRSGGEERPQQMVTVDSKYDTNDYLRFGSILQEYLGRPYKGKSKYEEGLDCSHFTQTVFKRFDNINIPRMASDQFKKGKEVQFKHLRYGDLVFFKTGRKKISHVGIYIGDNSFIHASTSNGVIISGMSEKYWAERYVGARRVLK